MDQEEVEEVRIQVNDENKELEEEEEVRKQLQEVNDDEENRTSSSTKLTDAMEAAAAKIHVHIEYVTQLCNLYFVIYMIGSMLMLVMDSKNISLNKRAVGVLYGIFISLVFFSISRWLHTRAVNKVNYSLLNYINNNNHEEESRITTTTAAEISSAVELLIIWCILCYSHVSILVTCVSDKLPRTSNDQLFIAQIVYMVIFGFLLNRLSYNQTKRSYIVIDDEMSSLYKMIQQQNSAAEAAADLLLQQHWKCTTPLLCGDESSCDCLVTKKHLNKVITTSDGYRTKSEKNNWQRRQWEHDQRSKLVDMLCEDARKKYQLSTEDTRILRENISSYGVTNFLY